MRKKYILGNWKMNGSLARNQELMRDIFQRYSPVDDLVVGVAPPALYVSQLRDILADAPASVWLGVQDVSSQQQGAFTGQISAAMAVEYGVRFALIGHSERRQYQHETSDLVADKVLSALSQQLVPVICIGETLVQRESGETDAIIDEQLAVFADRLTEQQASQVLIAYEPVWAIGTGLAATPGQVQLVHVAIRAKWRNMFGESAASQVAILYGGSLKPSNAMELLALPDVDGGLIGGAALVASDFLAIINAVHSV
jgi:triosephosphate isomerase